MRHPRTHCSALEAVLREELEGAATSAPPLVEGTGFPSYGMRIGFVTGETGTLEPGLPRLAEHAAAGDRPST